MRNLFVGPIQSYKTLVVYAELKEDVFMEQTVGFDDNSGRVCKLQESQYGLEAIISFTLMMKWSLAITRIALTR